MSKRKIRIILALGSAAMTGTSADGQDIFWSETGGFAAPNSGTIYTAAFDGSGKSAIATDLNRPIGVDLDPLNGHIYWAEDGFEAKLSRIVRANLDGSSPVILFTEEEHGFTNAQMIQVDVPRGHVYWTDYHSGVLRGNLDGTGYIVLGGHTDAFQYTALALDLVNDHIYFGDPTQNGVLFRMDTDGKNRIELARALSFNDFHFNSIALDVPKGHIYYPDSGSHEIKRMDLNGENSVTLLTDPGLNPYGIDLRSDRRLYWVGGLGQRIGTSEVDGVSNVDLQLLPADLISGFGIAVMPAPPADFRIRDISVDDSAITIRWEGGTPPYQLLKSAALAGGDWEPVGATTLQTEVTTVLDGSKRFYRVQSAAGVP